MGVFTSEKSKEAFSNIDGAVENEKSTEKTTERPPSYNQADELALAVPQLNLGGTGTTNDPVSADQCVAHLKLLAVLADLRDSISNNDGLFGLFDSEAERFPASSNEANVRIREKRWAVYTARADLESPEYETIVDSPTQVVWSPDNMPPIDILMVWHSHMLNPRDFLEDCIRYGRMSTWRTGFPFEVMNNCIDDRTLEYKTPESSQQTFENKVNLKWDNLLDPPGKELECPRCKKPKTVLWTEGGIGESLQEAFKENTGYADASFEAKCQHCQLLINHERLKVAKFYQDTFDLVQLNQPMPGSIYNLDGIPEGPRNFRIPLSWTNMIFPSRLLKCIDRDMLAFTDPRLDRCKSIDDLRSHMEVRLRDRKVLLAINGRGRSLLKGERIHFRRMMAHYWDNSSPFALDLVGAVIRQGTFVQKMDNIDWLHSPTVMETSERLIKKYKVFMDIMLQNPSKMAVPTLDVDLAWHTHQLQPRHYYNYSTMATYHGHRQFIDHDDKVDENKLSDGFEWTSKMYRRATDGGIYSECTCWYCEATRAPDIYDRLFSIGSSSRARNNADSLHDRPDISSDPERNPHISAHNAVRPTTRATEDPRVGHLQRIRLHQNYEKAARRAEKRGRTRSDAKSSKDGGYEPMYYAPYAWGYPMIVPYYGPYMCDPGISVLAVLGTAALGLVVGVLLLARVVVWGLLPVLVEQVEDAAEAAAEEGVEVEVAEEDVAVAAEVVVDAVVVVVADLPEE
ncbi:uncharacterized protein N7443_010142 [Penicillium atrosanguineum]|uniref:uncharacterized protein n=1 Tax=Penicillium atrosanguineum TaxID=1132637 RepID=UPI0023A526E4|nr:uncharacterized protein N7443_010142 [Penicillium atrosanguineum]KAJ5289889.1 hypothetical protein N7443_010142 [Penicillium atrosanguineum]